jgi:hypothetical protein
MPYGFLTRGGKQSVASSVHDDTSQEQPAAHKIPYRGSHGFHSKLRDKGTADSYSPIIPSQIPNLDKKHARITRG